ncbi:hypothetical protein K443DRAFT_519140 [Laccaria amethystina LaAM-08-1]|uniref:Uncharacterized protein n=1 Tax=Laccaria amethystina LaAM-08-1 TaxID=1095629 RepID=A0A0C9WM11_9AGAR|nr:hypothetical protein K443DRAFT_519140 [Laccaria amethystina LaAM-08-1]
MSLNNLPGVMISQSERLDHRLVHPSLNIHFHSCKLFVSQRRSCCAVAQRVVFKCQYICFVESSQMAVLTWVCLMETM